MKRSDGLWRFACGDVLDDFLWFLFNEIICVFDVFYDFLWFLLWDNLCVWCYEEWRPSHYLSYYFTVRPWPSLFGQLFSFSSLLSFHWFFNPLAVVPRLNRNTLFQIMSPPFWQWIIPLKVWQAEIPQIQPTFTTTKKQEGNSHQNYVVRRI